MLACPRSSGQSQASTSDHCYLADCNLPEILQVGTPRVLRASFLWPYCLKLGALKAGMMQPHQLGAHDCLLLALVSDHLSSESGASEELPYVLSMLHSHNLLASQLHESSWQKWHAAISALMVSKAPTARWAGASLLAASLRLVTSVICSYFLLQASESFACLQSSTKRNYGPLHPEVLRILAGASQTIR